MQPFRLQEDCTCQLAVKDGKTIYSDLWLKSCIQEGQVLPLRDVRWPWLSLTAVAPTEPLLAVAGTNVYCASCSWHLYLPPLQLTSVDTTYALHRPVRFLDTGPSSAASLLLRNSWSGGNGALPHWLHRRDEERASGRSQGRRKKGDATGPLMGL